MIYYVDIDETICECERNKTHDYTRAVPIKENIDKINELYDQGHQVTYWTARGSTTGIDWTDVTERQLKSWGAKYHELRLGKPHYDVYICDKAISAKDFFGNE